MILVAIIALLIGGAGGYIVADREEVENIPAGMHRMPDGTLMGNMAENDKTMMGGHMMNMTVESEREFIEGMIPHHQEAVDTAKEVTERGGSTPEIKELVQNIVIAQEKEIAEMKKWYQDWYGETYQDTGNYEPMMRELETLSGAELDRVFLEDMIAHHMGAIMMAQSVQPYIEHVEITTLTEAIMKTQSDEIAEMRSMLQSL